MRCLGQSQTWFATVCTSHVDALAHPFKPYFDDPASGLTNTMKKSPVILQASRLITSLELLLHIINSHNHRLDNIINHSHLMPTTKAYHLPVRWNGADMSYWLNLLTLASTIGGKHSRFLLNSQFTFASSN